MNKRTLVVSLIAKHYPLNNKDNINALIEDLKSEGLKNELNLMTLPVYYAVMQLINKNKVQRHWLTFKEQFHDNTLDEPLRSISEEEVKNTQSTAFETNGAQSTNSLQSTENGSGIQSDDVENSYDNVPFLPKSSLDSKKYIYGTYAEMALHNFFVDMDHIYTIINGQSVMDSLKLVNQKGERDTDFAKQEYWNEMFGVMENGQPEEKTKYEEQCRKYFPFLELMLDKKVQDKLEKKDNYVSVLKRLSDVLREVRNVCSHYRIELLKKQKRTLKDNSPAIVKYLINCFDGSRRKVKERFSFTAEEVECAIPLTKDRNNSYTLKKNYRYRIDNGSKEDLRLTEFGLAMFISLFLEKKYIKIMTDKLHLIENKDQKVIGEMMAVYRLKLYVARLSCKKDADAIALDILNELRKCPKELFEMLTPEDQKVFRVKAGVSDGALQDDVLLIRHSDRFAPLLMKYIDDANIFKNIRFQVSLGNFYYKFYNKRCIDSDSANRVRSLCKSITGFGRITEIENARKDIYKDLIREFDDVHKNTADEKPYLSDHCASYVFNGNRIGLWIPDDESRLFLPELKDDRPVSMAPTCWLSIYELPALAFLLALKGDKGGEVVETIIKTAVANYKRLFSDVCNGVLVPVKDEKSLSALLIKEYEIKLDDVPKKIKDYLLGRNIDVEKHFNTWATDLIARMIEQTERRKKKYNDDQGIVSNPKENRIGKKQYVEIRPGKLAEYLARDMMLFQPQGMDNKNKLTGLNFQVLQASLATYNDGDFERLRRLFTAAHFIGNADSSLNNPIVDDICKSRMAPNDIFELYKNYLGRKIKYLKNCLNMSQDLSTLPFLYHDCSKWIERSESFYKSLAGRYLKDEYGGTSFDKSLELPRGLFENAIRTELKALVGKYPKLCLYANDQSKNVSYLIYAYVKTVEQDDVQPFYNYKRNYSLFDTLWKKKPTDAKEYRYPKEIYELINKIKGERAVDKEIEKAVDKEKGNKEEFRDRCRRKLTELKDTETILKRYKVQDILLFMIAKKILSKDEANSVVMANSRQGGVTKQMKLREVTKDDFLSQPINFKITVKSANEYDKTIYQNNMKLKNYVQFYRFLSDRRMPSLLALENKKEIDRERLELELNTYDKVHPDVIRDTLNYEKEYYQQGTTKTYYNEQGTPRLPKLQEMIEERDGIEAQKMYGIRNSFAHTSYPKRYVVSEAVNENMPNKANVIYKVYDTEMTKYKKKQE